MTTELTNSTRKLYHSLSTVKGRRESGLFMAQGTKCVLDTFKAFELEQLLATAAWAETHSSLPCTVVKTSDLERISTLSTAPDVIAIYHIPQEKAEKQPLDGLVLALDCVQDPGNLGTLIRVADWMGVTDIYASLDTADVWSPKVVQATMGAIAQVKIQYVDLPAWLKCCELPAIGTFLDGESVYKADLPTRGVIVMGNEGNGISGRVAACINRRISIPPMPAGWKPAAESLNVAVAASIILSEFRRNG